MDKRKKSIILKVVVALLGFSVLVHVVSALTLDRIIEYKEVPFHSTKIPASMDGYTIAFISDTHAMTKEELNAVAQKLNTLQPDLLILGGDLGNMITPVQILSSVKTTDGIYGVEGNHDDPIWLYRIMEEYSVHPLVNSGVSIRKNFYLAGTEDLWGGSASIEKAIEGAHEEDFILLIAHNPDITMRQDTTSVDLTLSGHSHGGQVTVFGLWAPALTLTDTVTDYNQRFMSGWAKSRDNTPVFVSNGTGGLYKTPRVFARPQVILITLHSD